MRARASASGSKAHRGGGARTPHARRPRLLSPGVSALGQLPGVPGVAIPAGVLPKAELAELPPCPFHILLPLWDHPPLSQGSRTSPHGHTHSQPPLSLAGTQQRGCGAAPGPTADAGHRRATTRTFGNRGTGSPATTARPRRLPSTPGPPARPSAEERGPGRHRPCPRHRATGSPLHQGSTSPAAIRSRLLPGAGSGCVWVGGRCTRMSTHRKHSAPHRVRTRNTASVQLFGYTASPGSVSPVPDSATW